MKQAVSGEFQTRRIPWGRKCEKDIIGFRSTSIFKRVQPSGLFSQPHTFDSKQTCPRFPSWSPPLDLFHPGRISFFQLFFFLFIFLHICRQTIVAQWKFACRAKRDDCDTGMSQRGYHLTGTRDMLQWPRSSQPEKRVRNVEQCNVYSTLYPWKFLNFNFSCQWTFRRKIIFPRIYSPSRSWWK